MKKLVICTTQRSGSTFLCKKIAATCVIGDPNEYYLKANVPKINKTLAESILNNAILKGSTKNNVYSVKVMFSQLEAAEKVHYLTKGSSFDSCPSHSVVNFFTGKNELKYFYRFFEDAVWVFLERKDVVAQAVSREMSYQTGVCHVIDEGASKAGLGVRGKTCLYSNDAVGFNDSVFYNFDKLLSIVNKIKYENDGWQCFFKKYQIDPIHLFYEDLIADDLYIEELAQALDIDYCHTFNNISLRKVGNKKNTEWVARFRDDFLKKYSLLEDKPDVF